MKFLLTMVLPLLFLSNFSMAGFEGKASGVSLKVFNKINCGAGMTCTRTANGVFNMVSSPTITSGPFTITGDEATNAILTMQADQADDNADTWLIQAEASGNALSFGNNTSGSNVEKLSLSTAGVLTLVDSETITNAADVVTIASDDNHANLTLKGFEAKDAILVLAADESDDNGDDWEIKAAVGNSLTFSNDTTGTQVAKLTITTAGLATFAGSIVLADGEIISNAADVVTIAGDDADANLTLKGFEANDAILILSADESDDNGDDWEIKSATGNNLTFSNDTSGSQVVKFTITPAGAVSLVGDLSGDGGDQLVGFLRNQVAATATTIISTQCGSSFINTGAVLMELPEASAVLGCRLTFITGNASNFDINPDNADQILVQTNAAGDAMRNATLGNSITIEAISASTWAPVGIIGTWTDID